MASEGFDAEEWDADFLDQLVQAEELALSTQLPPNHHHPAPAPVPSPPPPPPHEVSYSPPRELSQRTCETYYGGGIPDSFDGFAPRRNYLAKERETDRLKKELNRVTKRLGNLEKECLDLKKEKDKKEEQLKVLHSRIETRDAESHPANNKEADGLVSGDSAPGQNVGKIQIDKTTEVRTSALQNACCLSEKLFGLWNSNDQKQGRVLVATLFKTFEADFHVLLNYLNSCGNNSNMALSDKKCPTQPIEFAKVLHVYSVFTKISNDILRLEDLLEALVDLCNLKNVFIVHWSLCVLHKILSSSFSMEKEFRKRENVIIEDPLSENTKSDTNGCGDSAIESLCFANVAEKLKQGQISSSLKLSSAKTPSFSGFFNHSLATSVSGVYQVSIFERMCLIATENNEEQIRHEALSVMNLILMRHNAYLERDKFAGELVFRSLSQLLRKGTGFSVQDQAVHALYLLCNCPKVIAMVSSCLKEDGEVACSKDVNDNSFPTFQVLNEILNGLADCVVCHGSATAEEMKRRRSAIVFLAFLGSSGKSGFEILLNHRLPKATNFLAIILQSLISDSDLQALKSAKKSGIAREQSLLIREALILLNRLVSHPEYSVPVLQVLTATRDMASLTVDVANRLTQKSNLRRQDDSITKQIRSEIVELAHGFKKRVFTFLGDNIS